MPDREATVSTAAGRALLDAARSDSADFGRGDRLRQYIAAIEAEATPALPTAEALAEALRQAKGFHDPEGGFHIDWNGEDDHLREDYWLAAKAILAELPAARQPVALDPLLDEHTHGTNRSGIVECRCGWYGLDWNGHFVAEYASLTAAS